jgi:lysozyme
MPYNELVFGNAHSWDLIIIDAGVAVVMRWETFKATRYKDMHKSGFKWAIGFGHVEGGENEPKIIPPDMVLTREQAFALLKLDLETKARYVRKKLKVPVNTYMFNALVSLCYNIGEGNFGGNEDNNWTESPVLIAINQERYVEAAARFVRHNRAWVKILDANGQAIMDPATGKNKVELREVNGLTFRRGCEMELFGRYMQQE